jgi:hypothetical protein
VHFGVNGLGLVTVYAKDIALLPDWQQAIWAGHNVGPDGGVSAELFASQVSAEPARTLAPEELLPNVLLELDAASIQVLGFPLFRHHDQVEHILPQVHRFRALNRGGLFSLAKDLARVVADRLDAAGMQKIAPPPKGTTWRSLKSLEGLLAIRMPPEAARSLLSPLVAAYELRHGDAHLAGGDIDQALTLADVDGSLPFVQQGQQLLHSCVSALHKVLDVLQHWGSLGPGQSPARVDHGGPQA